MTIRYLLLIILIPFLLSSCTKFEKTYPKEILVYKNSRFTDSLLLCLKANDNLPYVITALAELQDTLSVNAMVELLKKDQFRNDIYFALGQIGYAQTSMTAKQNIENILIENLPKDFPGKLAEALGKTGSIKTNNFFVSKIRSREVFPKKDVLMAYARLAIRGFSDQRMDSIVAGFLTDVNPDVRWNAVYALMRSANANFAGEVIKLKTDPEPRVRMDAARALGAMKVKPSDSQYNDAINGLVEESGTDPDWRVRVNALNALGNYQFKEESLKKIYFLKAFDATRDNDLHVRISAIRAMAKSYEKKSARAETFITPFLKKYLPQAQGYEQAEIFLALFQMFGDESKTADLMKLAEQNLQSQDKYARARTIEAIGALNDPGIIPILQKTLNDPFVLVQNNTIEALAKIKDEKARSLIENTLITQDVTLLYLAVSSLASDSVVLANKKRCEGIAAQAIRTFQSIKPPVDVESQTGVFDALGALKSQGSVEFLQKFLSDPDAVVARSAAKNLELITGKKHEIVAAKPQQELDKDLLEKTLSNKPVAIIHTSRGIVKFDFYRHEAPLTVVNFIKLAEKKYFDGVYFHRVVPNFVIQTGDPTGTGWGGPGYSIRSEFNKLSYDRGTVGMASAGKDTEGSQWFITHSPQPHLDGKYTIFAKVTEGMEVVDQIQVGDKIDKIEIIWK